MNRPYGGADELEQARWDFSSSSNATGPCVSALAMIDRADSARYPDPSYSGLRKQLAHWHDVDPNRILFAASVSEFIQRITAVSQRLVRGPVAIPKYAYGDYAIAARAWGRQLTTLDDEQAGLRWLAEPSSPMGQDQSPLPKLQNGVTVLDAVYQPLRLDGKPTWSRAARDQVFQLHSPNKALGLTGIRGAYVIAPNTVGTERWTYALEAAAPSWPLGSHAVAMLNAWTQPEAQRWLKITREILQVWRRAQLSMLAEIDIATQPSVCNFFCALLPVDVTINALRDKDIKLRDATDLGLPGWVRLSVQAPASQQVLRQAILDVQADKKDSAKAA